MAGMFPTMVSDQNDPNRRHTGPVGDTWPRNLQIAFYLICAAAVLMLVTAMFLISNGWPGDPNNVELRDTYMLNMRITAYGNIILAVALVSAASYFRFGSRKARRWAAVFIAVTAFLNVVAFILQLTAWASMITVILLAFAAFFAFRPDANAFVEQQSPRF